MKNQADRPAIHYGWFIVGAGTLCVFAGLGFGRFALGMLLPSMATALNLTYSQMGLISTCNFVGYLIAVLAIGPLTARFQTRGIIFTALLLVGISMLVISRTHSFLAILLCYTVTGLGSGASNVPMMALVSTWFVSKQRGRAAGFIVIGSGFAILLSGKLIPLLNRLYAPEGWRTNWSCLGIIVVAAACVCWFILRDRPEEKGLTPVGSSRLSPPREWSPPSEPMIVKRAIYHLAAIYFLFGATYVIYATFIVTTLIREKGFSEAVAGNFWSWVGFLSLFSGPVFGALSDKLGRKTGLVTVFAIQTVAYLLVGLDLPRIFLYVSIGCYGLVAWSIPSIMAALVGDYVGAQRAARVFGFVTFVFALGQISGPYVAGLLAERLHGFSASFLMAACLGGLAVLLSSRIQPPPTNPGSPRGEGAN